MWFEIENNYYHVKYEKNDIAIRIYLISNLIKSRGEIVLRTIKVRVNKIRVFCVM